MNIKLSSLVHNIKKTNQDSLHNRFLIFYIIQPQVLYMIVGEAMGMIETLGLVNGNRNEKYDSMINIDRSFLDLIERQKKKHDWVSFLSYLVRPS